MFLNLIYVTVCTFGFIAAYIILLCLSIQGIINWMLASTDTPETEDSDNIARYFLRQWKLTIRLAIVLILLFELVHMFDSNFSITGTTYSHILTNANDDITIATAFCLSLLLGLLFGIYFTIKISLPAHLFKYESSFDRAWAEINRTEDINYKLKHESKKRKRVMPH